MPNPHISFGFFDGQLAALAIATADSASVAAGTKKLNTISALFRGFKLTIGEYRQSLDRFFDDPLNANISIAAALRYCTLKADGATVEELERFLRNAR